MKRHSSQRSASKDGAAARRPVNRARARGLLKMNTSPAAVDVFTNSKSAALFAVPTPSVIGPKRSVEYFALLGGIIPPAMPRADGRQIKDAHEKGEPPHETGLALGSDDVDLDAGGFGKSCGLHGEPRRLAGA